MPNTLHSWQLQEAKNKLSEVIDEARHTGPQMITRHGKQTAVVLSVEEFQQLSARKKSFVQFFRDSPLVDAGVEFGHAPATPRPVVDL